MPLQSSGQIDFSDINVELGLTGTAQLSLGSAAVRALYGVPAGAIRLGADGYGKSNAIVPVGVTTAGDPIFYNFANNNNSWTASGATLTASTTYSVLNSTSTDPLIRRTVSFSGAKYPYVQIYLFRTSGVTWDGNVFYSTAGHGESGSFYNQMTQPTWDGVNFQWITVDMRSLAVGGTDWTNNTITNLRLDFGLAATDDFQIQYIVIRGTIYPVAGLYQSYQLGYHNENVNYMTAPTAEGATNAVNYPSIGANISYQWVGYFLAPTTGIYNFSLASDDGSYFWIGNNAVSGYTTGNANVFATFNTGTVTSGNIQLTAGTYYPVRVLYGNGTGAAYITLSFSGPGIATRTDGTGYFFYNADTTGI
jgi:hypothetical protein